VFSCSVANFSNESLQASISIVMPNFHPEETVEMVVSSLIILAGY
jgi:hypothetical protein